MHSLKKWWGEYQQKLLTKIANRSFKNNPDLLDRLAFKILEKAYGPAGEEDEDLEHIR
jgi:outer membrane protein TolC